MWGSIVEQGVELMVFGMGTVLVFLTVLVLAISLMSWVLRRYFPDPEVKPVVHQPVPVPKPATAQGLDNNVVVAITTAIHRHRANNRHR